MGGSQPEVERREFDTTVRVEGEKTVLLGGLVTEHSAEDRDRSSLPERHSDYRRAFPRHRGRSDKSEIILLLTPRVQGATVLREEINEFRALQGQDPLPEAGASKGK